MVKSAKAVMADRSLALSTLQSARSDVDGKRTKLAKLRGTPGIKVLPSPILQPKHDAVICIMATNKILRRGPSRQRSPAY